LQQPNPIAVAEHPQRPVAMLLVRAARIVASVPRTKRSSVYRASCPSRSRLEHIYYYDRDAAYEYSLPDTLITTYATAHRTPSQTPRHGLITTTEIELFLERTSSKSRFSSRDAPLFLHASKKPSTSAPLLWNLRTTQVPKHQSPKPTVNLAIIEYEGFGSSTFRHRRSTSLAR